MGIAERKAAQQFEQTHYPKLLQDLQAAAGFEVPVEVDWASLSVEGFAHLYAEAWPKVYFLPLAAALRAVGQDAPGRQPLQGTLGRIVIRNTSGNTSPSGFARLQDGVLTLDHEPLTNVDQGDERQRAIQQALEASPEPRRLRADDPLRAFLEWGAKGVDGVLAAVERIAARQQAGIPLVLPRLTLSLRSGRAVSGFVREVMEDRREGRAVLLYIPRESGIPCDEAVIIPVGTIETVSILDVPAFGALEREAQAVPPLLQVRRQLSTLEASVRAATGASLSLGLAPGAGGTADELRALGFLAERTREALETLVKDELVRAALREQVQRIHLGTGTQASVSLVDGTLEVTTSRRPPGWYTRRELEGALQAAL